MSRQMLKRHRVGGPETSCGQSPPAERSERPTNLAHRLLDRQLDRQVQRSFSKKCMRERFSRFRLSRSLDLHAPRPELPSQTVDAGRSRIMEIVAAGATIFGLTENGICAAFDSDSGKRICVLNTDTTEVVRSLFHNKANSTLITVAVHAVDQYSSLRCRSNPLSQLRAGVTDTGTALFTTESLRWPGFVEFDDVNGKVVTYSADVSMYKVWQMSDPSRVLYSLDGQRIDEIKISPGIMLLVLSREDSTGHVPLRLLSIETGETLVELEQPIVPGKKMEFVEQFNEKLLLKQEDSPLKIIDLLTRSVVTVKNQHFRTPSAFIFLYENQTFLAFRGHEVTVWNFHGEMPHPPAWPAGLAPGLPLLSRACGAATRTQASWSVASRTTPSGSLCRRWTTPRSSSSRRTRTSSSRCARKVTVAAPRPHGPAAPPRPLPPPRHPAPSRTCTMLRTRAPHQGGRQHGHLPAPRRLRGKYKDSIYRDGEGLDTRVAYPEWEVSCQDRLEVRRPFQSHGALLQRGGPCLAPMMAACSVVCSVRACLTAPRPRARQERGDIITGNTQGLLHVWTN